MKNFSIPHTAKELSKENTATVDIIYKNFLLDGHFIFFEGWPIL